MFETSIPLRQFAAASRAAAASLEGMPRLYSGTRLPDGTTFVSVNGRPLDARTDLRNDSATTFDWGYDGHGAPAQLALAVLAHHFGDDSRAQRSYETFLRCVIRGLPSESWALTGAEIDRVFADGADTQGAKRATFA